MRDLSAAVCTRARKNSKRGKRGMKIKYRTCTVNANCGGWRSATSDASSAQTPRRKRNWQLLCDRWTRSCRRLCGNYCQYLETGDIKLLTGWDFAWQKIYGQIRQMKERHWRRPLSDQPLNVWKRNSKVTEPTCGCDGAMFFIIVFIFFNF